MPRIRTLKPECWQDAGMGRLSRDARLLFVGLITQADDDGRLVAEPALLRAQIFPYDHDLDLDTIATWLLELERERLLVLYMHGRERFAALPSWHRHQKINRKTESRIPEPESEHSVRIHGGLSETSPPEGRERNGVEGVERNGSTTPTPFLQRQRFKKHVEFESRRAAGANG